MGGHQAVLVLEASVGLSRLATDHHFRHASFSRASIDQVCHLTSFLHSKKRMASVFEDKKNRMLYFDRTDTAQVVVDGAIGIQVYSMLASRDSSPATKLAVAGGSLLLGNYAYNTVLRDAVQAVLHPADAMIDAAQGHGTVPTRAGPRHTLHTKRGAPRRSPRLPLRSRSPPACWRPSRVLWRSSPRSGN